MANSKAEHSPQLVSLDDVAAMIESEDFIWVGSALSIPTPFLDRLANRHEELHDVTILGNTFINYSELLADSKYTDTFHIVSFFESSPFNSLTFKTNNIEYLKRPCGPYSKTICDKYKINVMVVEVCPPDNNGRCNLGVAGRAITPYLNKCKGITKKIAVINELQRPTFDDGELISIPTSDFDYLCICKHEVLKKAAN